MTSRNYGALRDSETAIKFLDRITSGPLPFAFDIEAGYVGDDKVGVSLQQFHPDYRITGISFTVSPGWARYIPFDHDGGGNVDNLVGVARALWRMLRTGRGVAHNAAYELKGMSRWFREMLWNDPELGQEVRQARGMFPIHADTMLLVWLAACYEPKLIGKDLKSVCLNSFGMEMTKFNDLFPLVESDLGPAVKRGRTKYVRFNTRNAFSPKIVEYACEDSVGSLLTYEKHYEELKDTPIFKVEMALIPILVEMEAGPIDENGVATGNMLFDWPTIRKKSAEIAEFGQLFAEEILVELSERLHRQININLGSPKQLADILFGDKPTGLGLPIKVRSDKTNFPSTSDDALKVIAKSDPIIRMILQYRQIMKLNSSYLAKFIAELGYSGTGYVFPNHNQFGALTGRMSVDQVSYQQWPKPYHFELKSGRTFDLNFRDLFIAPEGFRIVGFDYANVEMRIAGALSGERKIIDAFNSGQDLHKATAAATFKVPFEEVTKKQRSAAKTLNFAILYGSGANNIAEMLTSPDDPVTKEDAENMLAAYLEGYPALANWIAEQQAHGRECGYVLTHFKRKFTVWEYQSPMSWVKAKGDRMTVNAPVQGTAADILKIAMVRTQNAIKDAGLEDKIRMTLTVHDALEFLVHESVSTQQVIDLIEPCVNFPVPGFPLEIRADWHEGFQWGAEAEIKLDQNKQIVGYEFEYELPWLRQSFFWEGKELHDVLDQYYAWESNQFGMSAPFYAKRNPSFVVPSGEILQTKLDLPESRNKEDAPGVVLPAEDRETPKTITITLLDMPTPSEWSNFERFMNDHKGLQPVVVETPDGSITLDSQHHISMDHQPEISMIFGGAGLAIAASEVDADDVMSGVSL